MRPLVLSALLGVCLAHAQTVNVIRAPANAVVLADSSVTRTVDCAGHSVVLSGSGSTFTLTGTCDFVNVTGSNNTIALSAARVLQLTGNSNHVTWVKRPRYVFIQASTTGNSATRAP